MNFDAFETKLRAELEDLARENTEAYSAIFLTAQSGNSRATIEFDEPTPIGPTFAAELAREARTRLERRAQVDNYTAMVRFQCSGKEYRSLSMICLLQNGGIREVGRVWSPG